MKFILLTGVFLIAVGTTTFAQDCSHVKETKDAFTRETSLSSELKCGQLTIRLERVGKDYFVGFLIMMGSYSNTSIKTSDKIFLRLDNDEVVAVAPDEDAPPTSTPGDVIWTRWTTRSKVGIGVLKSLSEHLIVGLKVTAGGQTETQEVKAKQAKKISETANCIIHRD